MRFIFGYFCRSNYICLYILALMSFPYLPIRLTVQFSSHNAREVGFDTDNCTAGFECQRPRNFAAPRAPAGGAAFWRPAPRAPQRPCQPWGRGAGRALVGFWGVACCGAALQPWLCESAPRISGGRYQRGWRAGLGPVAKILFCVQCGAQPLIILVFRCVGIGRET